MLRLKNQFVVFIYWPFPEKSCDKPSKKLSLMLLFMAFYSWKSDAMHKDVVFSCLFPNKVLCCIFLHNNDTIVQYAHVCARAANFPSWGFSLLSSPRCLTSMKWLPLIMPLTTALQFSREQSRDWKILSFLKEVLMVITADLSKAETDHISFAFK